MIAREEQNRIVALKWKDVRDVKILLTKHELIMVDVPTKHGEERMGNVKT